MIGLPGWLEQQIRRYNDLQQARNLMEAKRNSIEEERNKLLERFTRAILNKKFA